MNMQMTPPPGGDVAGTVIVVAGTLILLVSTALAIKATIRPGETDPEHPKNVILRDDR